MSPGAGPRPTGRRPRPSAAGSAAGPARVPGIVRQDCRSARRPSPSPPVCHPYVARGVTKVQTIFAETPKRGGELLGRAGASVTAGFAQGLARLPLPRASRYKGAAMAAPVSSQSVFDRMSAKADEIEAELKRIG